TVTRDVTRSVLGEQALRESEELFRRIFDESPIPTVLSDTKGRFAKVNDAYCDLLGYTREDLLSMNDARFVHPAEAAPAREGRRRIFSGELSRIHREKRFRTADGRELVGMLTAAPIHDESGNVVYLLSIIEDITEQKRAAEELSRIADMKSDFVTLVSHELRAPLTNMRGGLELIAHDTKDLPESARRTLSIVSHETSRLNRFVETILDVSRLDAGQLPIVLGPVAVNVVIDRATRGAGLNPGNVDPAITCAPDLPLAWADELQLEHVFRNLIRNANHHSPAGQRIRIEAAAAPDRIIITVTDHGIGISREDLPHVFEAFRRTRDSELKYKGYGLGLYFAKRLIEAQGGDIQATSPITGDPLSPGARFTVRLPLAPQRA
ncbi:MAG: HAMP domain-containing histidine kinase, partial [Chloroflexi bacterium]|nr:HAMP domain-containing histidine kinase [Chloroflexota bacterium]